MENKYISFFGKQIEKEKFKGRLVGICKEVALIAASLTVGFLIWLMLAL